MKDAEQIISDDNSFKKGKLRSGRADSNRRRPAWEADILPLNYARKILLLFYSTPVPVIMSNLFPWRRQIRIGGRAVAIYPISPDISIMA